MPKINLETLDYNLDHVGSALSEAEGYQEFDDVEELRNILLGFGDLSTADNRALSEAVYNIASAGEYYEEFGQALQHLALEVNEQRVAAGCELEWLDPGYSEPSFKQEGEVA